MSINDSHTKISRANNGLIITHAHQQIIGLDITTKYKNGKEANTQ